MGTRKIVCSRYADRDLEKIVRYIAREDTVALNVLD